MYNNISFFGNRNQLLSFTRNLRVAELLDVEYEKNVRTNVRLCPCGKPDDGHYHSPFPNFSEEHGIID